MIWMASDSIADLLCDPGKIITPLWGLSFSTVKLRVELNGLLFPSNIRFL